jgi:hypothetical protein
MEDFEMESRNDPCGCHSNKKYKKCCGRFSLGEMTEKLSEFAANNRRKNKLVEQGLKMLRNCEATAKVAYLCLVNPKPNFEGFIDWTVVDKGIPGDEQEAVATRRVLAGYIPLGCLLRSPNWRMILDKSFVPDEIHDIYVAFARMELNFIAATIDSKVDQNDGSITPLKWSDRSYPGQPLKPRQPGTIKIEVDLKNRSVRIISEPLASHLDMPFDDDMIDGKSNEEDAIYVARHVMAALEQIPLPEGMVPGDIFEVYLMESEGNPKLLARINAEGRHDGLTGGYGMGGNA